MRNETTVLTTENGMRIARHETVNCVEVGQYLRPTNVVYAFRPLRGLKLSGIWSTLFADGIPPEQYNSKPYYKIIINLICLT